MLLTFLPFESLALVVTMQRLPSAETTMRPLAISLSAFLILKPSVRSSIFVYERAAEVGSPVTGWSFPSNLPVHSL
jgi:hypothetical protein